MNTAGPLADHPGARVAPAQRLARGVEPSDPICLVVCLTTTSDLVALRTAVDGIYVELVSCQDGAVVLFEAGRRNADLLILTGRVPVVDTATITTAVRRIATTPILIGVGPGESDAARAALVAGANRVLPRPYDPAHLRSSIVGLAMRGTPLGPLRRGALAADPIGYEATLRGRPVAMPPRELEVLLYLMRHCGRTVTVTELERSLWTERQLVPGSKAVLRVIASLRRRLGDNVGEPRVIRTVRGHGYRLFPPTD